MAENLKAAVKKGDVEGVRRCLAEKGVNVNTTVRWLVIDECKADARARLEIAVLLRNAGAKYAIECVLVAAVREGDIEGVKRCLAEKGIDVNAQIDDWPTAAHWLVIAACKADVSARLEIAVLLRDAGAKNAIECVLAAAVKEGDVEVVKRCLAEKGVDVNAKIDNWPTAAEWLCDPACKANMSARLEIAVLLRNAGAKSAIECALAAAVKEGDVEVVKRCLAEKGVDVNAEVSSQTVCGYLCDTESQWPQKMEIAVLLSNAGATDAFQSLLIHAVVKGDVAAVKQYFQQQDIDVNKAGPVLWFLVAAPVKPDSPEETAQLQTMRLLIEHKADPNTPAEDGLRALHFASTPKIVKMLLEANADIDAVTDDYCWTALMGAVERGWAEIVRVLLEHGANANIKLEDGKTALDIEKEREVDQAAFDQCKELIRAHVARMKATGSEPAPTKIEIAAALVVAVKNGDIEDVRNWLAQKSVDVNMKAGSRKITEWLARDDCKADTHTRLEIALLLARAGADSALETVLCWAAGKSSTAAVKECLKQKSIDINKCVKFGKYSSYSALAYAVHCDGAIIHSDSPEEAAQLQTMRLLIEHNADPNTPDGYRALHYAKTPKAATMLLEARANIDAACNTGWTALMAAVYRGRVAVVRVLLEHGANANIKTQDGETALDIKKGWKVDWVAFDQCKELIRAHMVKLKTKDDEAARLRNKLAAAEQKEQKERAEKERLAKEAKEEREKLRCTEIAYSDLVLVEKIGAGGFGEVWLGLWKSRGNEKVAIKRLHAEVLSADAVMEFKREVAVMQSLHSSYFLHILGACFEKGRYCMVTELAKRGSLWTVLHAGGHTPLSQDLRNRLALECARGLLHLHGLGFVHRDIKSPNILITEDWHAKLSDFGLTRARTETKTITKTSSSAFSVRWTAPELFSAKAQPTTASDIFSFGVLLFEIATREVPFKHASDPIIIHSVSKGEREDIPATVPKPLTELITRCWSQEPANRPDMCQVVQMLQALVPESPGGLITAAPGPKTQMIGQLLDVAGQIKAAVVAPGTAAQIPGFEDVSAPSVTIGTDASSPGPTTSSSPASPSSSPSTTLTLSALFDRLSLSEYLPAFAREKYLPSDLLLLSTDELKELIPHAGPRKRLEQWIKQQQSQ